VRRRLTRKALEGCAVERRGLTGMKGCEFSMIGLSLDIVGAFLIAVEAIKLTVGARG
jgi:hypothetical protein